MLASLSTLSGFRVPITVLEMLFRKIRASPARAPGLAVGVVRTKCGLKGERISGRDALARVGASGVIQVSPTGCSPARLASGWLVDQGVNGDASCVLPFARGGDEDGTRTGVSGAGNRIGEGESLG